MGTIWYHLKYFKHALYDSQFAWISIENINSWMNEKKLMVTNIWNRGIGTVG